MKRYKLAIISLITLFVFIQCNSDNQVHEDNRVHEDNLLIWRKGRGIKEVGQFKNGTAEKFTGVVYGEFSDAIGQHTYEYEIVDGIPHGLRKEWDTNGNLYMEITYNEGQKIRRRKWNEKGELIEEWTRETE